MLLAQSTSLGNIGDNGSGLGPFGAIGKTTDATVGAKGVINTISSIIGVMTVAAAIWFLLQIVFGGYEWMSAAGDSKRIEAARNRITNAFVGIVIVVGAWSLLAVTGQFFGFNTLVSPQEFINQVAIPK